MYEAHQNGGALRSSAEGDPATRAPVSGNYPALATHDGVTVYEAHASGGVRIIRSPAEGGPAPFAPAKGSPSGDRPALTTHDGVTVYEAHTSGGVLGSSAEGGPAPHAFRFLLPFR